MSDEEEDTSMDFAGGGRGLGGLFNADKAQLSSGNDTFKWKPPVKEKKKKPVVEEPPAEPEHIEAAMVKLYDQTNQSSIGVARCSIKLTSSDKANIIFTGNDRRILLDIPLTSVTYWTQTPYDGQQQYVSAQVVDANGYALVYSIQFKRPDEATSFTFSVYLIQYSLSLKEGNPRQVYELIGGEGEQLDQGDMVGLKYKYFQTTTANNKLGFLQKTHAYDESKEGDAKKVRIGDGKAMRGVERNLREMTKGQRRFMILTPDETLDGSGSRHPVLNNEIIIGCYIDVSKVKRAKGDSSPAQSSALVIAEPQPVPVPVAVAPVVAEPVAVVQPEPTPPIQQAAVPVPVAAPAPVAAAPSLDTNTLLTTLLVNQLQGGQAPSPTPSPNTASSDNSEVLRGVDRLMVQMGQLYQKMDHIDITRKLEENNDKVEVMFRRVMGKAPTAGFDVAAAGIKGESDTATLWAEIEKREKKIDELTESYHNALASISNNKDETNSLKNDIQIERDTAIERLKEANERHRLVVLDYDIKARTEKDSAVEAALKQGKEEGYKLGFAEGEREAFLKHVCIPNYDNSYSVMEKKKTKTGWRRTI